jgi:hypothetical protein
VEESDPHADRERFRDEFQFSIAPLRDEARINYEGALINHEGALKFADSGIKALFGLNGGGLIALPAFVALFKTDPHAVAVWIAAAMVTFIIGLTAAAVVCLFAYLSAMTGVEALLASVGATNLKYALLYRQIPQEPTTVTEIQNAEQQVTRLAASGARQREIAVALSVISLLAFVIATCFAGWALVQLT